MIDPKYIKDLTPPQKVLDACFVTYLSDPIDPMWKMKRWTIEHCKSFVWAESVDTSDVSYEYDSTCAFYFGEESDKLLFVLKYST
jgi:hypothetical protein